MWFKRECKVCAEKDKRIEELKQQVEFFKGYIQPTRSDPTLLSMEAQKILDGSLSPVIEMTAPSDPKLDEMAKINQEAHQMWSGEEIIV